MKNLKPPIDYEMIIFESKEIFEKVKNNRNSNNRLILNNIYENVVSRYKEYKENIYTLESISDREFTYDSYETNILKKCYDYERVSFLQNEIIYKSYIRICPYCDIGTADTIDHYLPRNKYPEFSFFLINLLPCCSKCNTKKSELFLENNQRLILNFYYDYFFDIKFLKVYINYSVEGLKDTIEIKYELDFNNINDEKQKVIIKNHFDKLELLKKYSEFVNEELSEIMGIIDNNDETIEFFNKYFNVHLNCLKRKNGLNHWKTALYEEVVFSNFIEDYTLSKTICAGI